MAQVKKNDIIEKIFITVFLGANIFAIIYFMLQAIEIPERRILLALSIVAFLGLLYGSKPKLLRKKEAIGDQRV